MIENMTELVAAAGLSSHEELRPWHINYRVEGPVTRNYEELYPRIAEGCLLSEDAIPEGWKIDWEHAASEAW